MRKSTLFISAALTTFMLAVMFGVASAYQKIVQTGVATQATQQQSQQAQPVNKMAGTSSTVDGALTIEQAADLASNVIGRTDLYAAENSQLNGVDAYLVTFSSGDLVYVGLDGKVLSISKLPVNYVTQVTSNGGGHGGGDNGGGASSVSAPSAPSAPVVSGGGDHSNEDNPNNTEDHANEDHPSEGEHDD